MAEDDFERLPLKVESTYSSKIEAIEKNLNIGAEPEQAFDKYMSGNMHPVLQINLGRDFRAWFLEGKYIDELDNQKIYGWRILTKNEAEKLTEKIRNPIQIFHSAL